MAEVKLPPVKPIEMGVSPVISPPPYKRGEIRPEELSTELELPKRCSRAILLKRGDIICGDITAEDGWVTVSEPKKGDYTATELVFRERGPLAPKKLLIPREEVELIVEM